MSFFTYFELMTITEKLSPTIFHFIFSFERTGHVSYTDKLKKPNIYRLVFMLQSIYLSWQISALVAEWEVFEILI